MLNGFSEADPAEPAAALPRRADVRRPRDHHRIASAGWKTSLKKPRPAKQRDADQLELALLQRIAAAFEANQSPATLGLKEDEEKAIRSFQLLTLKPEFVLVNIGDDKVNHLAPPELLQLSPTRCRPRPSWRWNCTICRRTTAACSCRTLAWTGFVRDDAVRAVFAGDGADRLPYGRLRRMPGLGDAGRRRRRGGRGQIHTDLARGFVRGEVLAWADFVKLYGDAKTRVGESMKEARTAGLLRQEGKTYIVKDGDIMHILAST